MGRSGCIWASFYENSWYQSERTLVPRILLKRLWVLRRRAKPLGDEPKSDAVAFWGEGLPKRRARLFQPRLAVFRRFGR
jgi:hypothetical protein